MELRFHRKQAAVAVLVISGWGNLQLSADENHFIQQPRRVASSPTKSAPAVTVSVSSGQPVSLSAPPGRLTSPRMATTVESVPDAVVATSPTTLTIDERVLSDAPPVHTPTITNQIQQSVPAEDQPHSSQLRWLARGAVPQAQQSSAASGILEISNPSYIPPQHEIATSRVTVPEFAPRDFSQREFSQRDALTPATPTTHEFFTTPFASTPSTVVNEALRPTSPVVQTPVEPESPTKLLASLVSSQIIAQRPGSGDSGRSVAPVDAPPGWQAIGEQLSQRISSCEELLNRKAYFSAREEAEAAMLYLVRVLDLMSNGYTSEPAWHAACKAMQEAEDFSTAQRLTSDSGFLRRIILSHETPVLKDVDASTLAPLAAAQHYRQYAEHKLAESAQGHPWAAEVIYALGRTYQAQADVADDGSEQTLRWKAVTLYRGARTVAPYNSVATNQLGYVLLQMDRPVDAREALVASINSNPSLAAYENLVETSRRLGDAATGNWATQQSLVLRNSIPQQSETPPVVEVDPRTFAALSPYAIGPAAPRGEPVAQPYRTATFSSTPNSQR